MRRQSFVGEDFETRKAFRNRFAHLIENPERQRSAQRDMKAVVDVRLAGPALCAAAQSRRNVGAGMDEAEVDMRGRAAEGHPDRVLLRTQRELASPDAS